jgi:hypothetical protein
MYYGSPDGYNNTSDLSVIFDEKIRISNPSGLAKKRRSKMNSGNEN